MPTWNSAKNTGCITAFPRLTARLILCAKYEPALRSPDEAINRGVMPRKLFFHLDQGPRVTTAKGTTMILKVKVKVKNIFIQAEPIDGTYDEYIVYLEVR
ncbi:jg11456 [Pararge aegeria aegeria]|uniref:Jg11456 protein n=1 Tax=Pararge aegeria aegeria TaxID=348720 RepID=A0A8S4RVN5_9NEOP|nr:jg11456 [Pararge aegeria aegeria]